MNKILEQGLNKLELFPSDKQEKQLEDYISDLCIWNLKLNLVGKTHTEDLVIRHILDCLAGLDVLRNLSGETLCDVGSGAGLPGLLLSIFMEDKEISLIERSGKKAGFLEFAIAKLNLANRVKVINNNVEEVNDSFDIVVLRAFREFSDYYKKLLSIKNEGGIIAAYKGKIKNAEEDISRAGIDSTTAEIKRMQVPFLSEERCMLLLY